MFLGACMGRLQRGFAWIVWASLSMAACPGAEASPRATDLEILTEAKAVESIPVLRESYSQQILQKLGFTNIYTVTKPEQLVPMVLAGRARVVCASNLAVPPNLAKIGANPTDLEPIFTVARTQTYFTFSKGSPPTLVKQWQEALDAMKRDGTFEAIYSKWFPKETPPGPKPEPAYIASP